MNCLAEDTRLGDKRANFSMVTGADIEVASGLNRAYPEFVARAGGFLPFLPFLAFFGLRPRDTGDMRRA